MSARLTCVVGRMSASLPATPFPLSLEGRAVEEYFAAGSGGDIAMRLEYRPEPLSSADQPAEAHHVHKALAKLTGNPTLAGTFVTRIGVVIARTFAPRPGIFGIMFDRGFVSDNSIYGRVPREGCAVFAGAIAAARPPSDFAAELAFTTIHELGHVFNLLHREPPHSPLSFMSSSSDRLLPQDAYGFLPEHRSLLARCSTSRYVHPGGSPFQDLGTLTADNAPRATARASDGHLELRVSMPRAEFWSFEPVELDVELRVAEAATRRVQAPDAVDPGYDVFRIWIEEPSGERRRYRPTKHFCGTGSILRLGPGEGIRRDISVFGESGGYTFRRAGNHRLWVELDLPRGGVLKSNALNANVLPELARNRYVQKAKPILESADSARLLFYRMGSARSSAFGRLGALAKSVSKEPAAAEIHYALGRVLLHEVRGTPSTARQRSAHEHLSRAVDHPGLSPHRRELALRLLSREGSEVRTRNEKAGGAGW